MNPDDALDIVLERSEQFMLITPNNVKVVAGLAANINNDNLITGIIRATDLRIQPILGDTLYENLKAHYIAVNYVWTNLPDGSTFPDNIDYKTLYSKIYKALCWWSYMDSLLTIAVKTDEKGIMFNNADYSTNGELVAYSEVKAQLTKVAEAYTDILVCYVKSAIIDAELKEEQIESSTTEFSTYFPKKSNGCNNC